MSDLVSLFIIVFTVVNVAACVWLLWWTARTRSAAAPATQDGGPERTGHVWDGDLEEYNNPLPRWWLWLFIITVVFGSAYLVIYPGLGAFLGTKQWSSIAAYEEQERALRAQFESRLAHVPDTSLAALAGDPDAMSAARNLFGANCSTCHGSDARGARGFPNLTDHDWLWGNSEDSIIESIANGRHAAMPALGEVLGREGVNEAAAYVLSLSGVKAPHDWVVAGKARFEMLCTGCHGADARGNQQLGAPDLTDNIWLFGSDFTSVSETIARGRDSAMPAHATLLGDIKVRLLAAYVLSLSADALPGGETQTAAAAPGDGG